MPRRNGVRHVLEVGHRDGLALVVLEIGVGRHQIAERLARRQAPRRAVAGEEHEHAVVLLDAGRIGQPIADGGEDAVARRFAVEQQRHVVGFEAIAADQHFADRLGVVDRVGQRRPVLVFVDADDDRPAVAIEGRGVGRRRGRGLRRGRHREAGAVPADEFDAALLQLVEDPRQRLHGALLDVVEQHDAAPLAVEGLHHAIGDRQRQRIGPVLRVDVPQHRGHVLRLHGGEDARVAGAVGRPEQRRRRPEHGPHDAVRRLDLLADVPIAEPRHRLVREGVVGEREAGAGQLAAGGGGPGRLDRALAVDRADVLADVEKDGRDAALGQHRADGVGVFRMRTVVEGQRDVVERQPLAGHLERRLGLRLAAGLQHDVEASRLCLDNRRGRVARREMGDVGFPRLAVDRHPALAEPAEHALELLGVEGLDLVEGALVVGDPGAQGRRHGGIRPYGPRRRESPSTSRNASLSASRSSRCVSRASRNAATRGWPGVTRSATSASPSAAAAWCVSWKSRRPARSARGWRSAASVGPCSTSTMICRCPATIGARSAGSDASAWAAAAGGRPAGGSGAPAAAAGASDGRAAVPAPAWGVSRRHPAGKAAHNASAHVAVQVRSDISQSLSAVFGPVARPGPNLAAALHPDGERVPAILGDAGGREADQIATAEALEDLGESRGDPVRATSPSRTRRRSRRPASAGPAPARRARPRRPLPRCAAPYRRAVSPVRKLAVSSPSLNRITIGRPRPEAPSTIATCAAS